ncbi:MAG: MFS transporter [Planctomycetota bacterium]|nr:MFS transporter [Planctomycetota bacterium]
MPNADTPIDLMEPAVRPAAGTGRPAPGPIEPAGAPRQSFGPHGAWRPRPAFWTIQLAHTIVDIYPIFFASLMLALKDRLGLDAWEIAVLYATGPVVSGVPQVFFAWMTDKLDSRIFGWLGLAVGAVCICSIGLAQSFWQLWLLQLVGMLATGAFHPVCAALAGQLGGALRPGLSRSSARAWGVAVFYTAGMAGGFLGAMLCTRINDALGMVHLLWLLPPGLAAALALWAATHAIPHRHANHSELHAAIPPAEARQRWWAVTLLFWSNVQRFTTNTALPILFAIWAESRIPGDISAATKLNGNLLAALTVGMGICGLLAGRLSPVGREKRSMIALTLIGAVAISLCGYLGDLVGVTGMYVMAALSAIGFAAIIPTTISLAQRLLPGRTGLASGLMLGTAWGLSFLAPVLTEWFIGARLDVAHLMPAQAINRGFVGFGCLLLLSAVLTAMIPGSILRKVAEN